MVTNQISPKDKILAAEEKGENQDIVSFSLRSGIKGRCCGDNRRRKAFRYVHHLELVKK